MQGSWRSTSHTQRQTIVSNGGYGINGGISPLLQGSYLESYDTYETTQDGLPAYFGEMQGPGIELEDPLEKDNQDLENEIFQNDPLCQTSSISHVPQPQASLGAPQSFPRMDSAIQKLDLHSQVKVSISDTFLQREADQQFTVFQVQLSSTLRSWQVLRRYRQFLTLHEGLSRKMPGLGHKLPHLPGKRVFGSSLDPHFVDERRKGLEAYLQNLCKFEELWKSQDFIAFLDDSSSFLCTQVQIGKLIDYVSELETLCHQMQSHLELYRVNLETQSSETDRLRQQVAELEGQWKSEYLELSHGPHSQRMRHSMSENVLGRGDPRTIQQHPPPHSKRYGSPGMSLFSTWNISRTPQSHAISIPLGEARDSDDELTPGDQSLAYTPSSSIFRNMFSPASPPLGMSAPLENMMPYGMIKPQPAPAISRAHADPEPLGEGVLALSDLVSLSLGPLDRRADQLLRLIAPTPQSHAYRASMFAFISQQVRRTLGAQCFAVASYALRAYLPDEDVAVSAFLCRGQEQTWFIRLNEALCKLSSETQMEGVTGALTPEGNEACSPEAVPPLETSLSSLSVSRDTGSDQEDGQLFHHLLSNVNFVNSREGNQRIKCLVDNVSVDVGANQLGDLTLVAFLEDADQRVDSHLFKKTLLLVKAWWLYETRPLAASSAISLLDSDTLAVMVLALLTVPPQHPTTGQPLRLTSPVQVAALFFAVYARFPWDKYCVTLEGPRLLSSLNNPLESSQQSPKGHLPTFWEGAKPSLASFFPPDAMERYVSAFGLTTTSGGGTGKKPSGSQPHSLSDEEVGGSRGPSRCNSPGPSSRGHFLRMDSNCSEDNSCASNKEDSSVASSKVPFPVRAMNVMHPLDSSTNLVDESMNKRKANRAISLLQTGAKTLDLVLKSLKGDLDGESVSTNEVQDLVKHQQSLQQWDAMFALTWARFGQGWRPDTPYPLVDMEGLKRTPNQQLHEATIPGKGKRDIVGGSVLTGELEVLWENLKYCSFLLESEVTDSALRTLTKEILGEKGPLPVGEIGKLLQEATSNASLSTTLKDQFGGLKKFLEKYPENFLISVDHPFNPHVYLKSLLSEEEIQQILKGELAPAPTSKKSKKASRRSKKGGSGDTSLKDDRGSSTKDDRGGGHSGEHIPSGQATGPQGPSTSASLGGDRRGNSHLSHSELRQALSGASSQQQGLSLRLGGQSGLQLQPGIQITTDHSQTQQVRYVGAPQGIGMSLASLRTDQQQVSSHPAVQGHPSGTASHGPLNMNLGVGTAAVGHSQGSAGGLGNQQLYGINVGGQIQLYKQQVVGVGANGAQILRMVPLGSQQQPQSPHHQVSSQHLQQHPGGVSVASRAGTGGSGLPPHHPGTAHQSHPQQGGARAAVRSTAAPIDFPQVSSQNLHRFSAR